MAMVVLPGVACADPVATPLGSDVGAAGGNTEVLVGAEPTLDLTFEAPAAAELRPRTIISSGPADSAERAPKAPFSVGLDIKTRHEIGDEAREDDSDQATLADDVAGIVKRSTFGLTGTYRF